MTPDEFRRIRRGILDLTQARLGDELGLSRETIVAIERGSVVKPVYAIAIRHLAERAQQPAE